MLSVLLTSGEDVVAGGEHHIAFVGSVVPLVDDGLVFLVGEAVEVTTVFDVGMVGIQDVGIAGEDDVEVDVGFVGGGIEVGY